MQGVATTEAVLYTKLMTETQLFSVKFVYQER